MASNAWERAQAAIAQASQRATERDDNVITADNAESPFDASATTVLPGGLAARRGAVGRRGERSADEDHVRMLHDGREVAQRPQHIGLPRAGRPAVGREASARALAASLRYVDMAYATS